MADRLFGMETEYAFTARGHDGRPLNPGPLVEQVERLAAQTIPSVPGMRSSGIFLQNASRMYRDPAGNYTHLEIAGPECANPWDVVRYLQAGERQLVQLAAELQRANSAVSAAAFNKTNIDYSGSHASWGCHESYLTTKRILGLSRQIIPHLVSRIAFTGAGGFNNRSPGIEFLLSPRVAHTSTIENVGSQYERPIFHTRDEPLCEGFFRLHVICGESLHSETAAWLKIATTAVVVAMADADVAPGEAMQFVAPVEAMRIFARDPSCRARALLTDGRTVTALDAQRHYLELAERHADADFMPAYWTGELCREWRAMLDRLEQGPSAVAQTFDWAIKLELFRNHAARRGFSWEVLAVWNEALRRVQAAAQKHPAPGAVGGATGVVPGTHIPITPAVSEVLAAPPGPGLDWAGLPAVLALRQELFEIDWRCGELGDGNLLAQLDRSGVLRHRVPGVENIEHAMEHPPGFGRAKIRGQVIRRVAHVRERFACDWKGIFDTQHHAMLDLSDPFAREERWRQYPPARPSGPDADPELARLVAGMM